MALNFHQLHVFFTVAEKGSFSSAAQALYMTQPAVTMQVQALEEHFGSKMFLRTSKKIELTDAGRVLLPYANRMINLMKETEVAMASYTRLLKGKLHLAASLTLGEFILPQLLGPFGQAYPHISINMKVMNTSQILEEILHNQLNFALIEAPIDHPDVHTEAVMSDELLLIVPAAHKLAHHESLHWEDMIQFPFIMREQGSGTRRVFEEELQRNGMDPARIHVLMELGSTGAIKSAVEANLGISVLSRSAVKHELTLGLLVTKPMANIRFIRNFYSIYLRSTLLPLPAIALINFIRELDTIPRSDLDENS